MREPLKRPLNEKLSFSIVLRGNVPRVEVGGYSGWLAIDRFPVDSLKSGVAR